MTPSPGPPPLHDRAFGDAEAVASALALVKAPQLRDRARSFGWTLSGQRRDDLLAQMVAHYGDPSATARAAAALPPAEQRMLGVMAWLGPGTARDQEAAYDRLQRALPPAAQEPPPYADGRAARSAAGQAGLLLLDPATSPVLFAVPWPLSVAVPPPAWTPRLALPDGWRREEAADPSADLAAAALALERLGRLEGRAPFGELDVSWQGSWPVLAEEAPASATWGARGRTAAIPLPGAPLGEAAQAEVGRAIGDADRVHGWFVAALLRALGVLASDRTGALRLDAGALDAWLALPAAERLASALAQWPALAYPTWDDHAVALRAGDGVHPRRMLDRWNYSPSDYSRSQAERRVDLLYGLARLPRPNRSPDGDWVDGAALARLVVAAWPQRYLSPAAAGWCLAAADNALLVATEEAGRRIAEASFARLMRGPLRWLGLVETAADPADPSGSAWAVRLSALGRAVMTGAAEPPPRAAAARWDAAALAVDVPLGGDDDAALAAARRHGAYAGAGAAAGTHRFRLGPDTVARAFGAGEGPADIADRFAAARLELPPPVAEAVASWWARWGHVNAYRDLAVIEVADAHLAAVLRATTALDEMLVYAAGPTAFVVPEDAVDGLLEQLRRAGHTPRVTTGRPADGEDDEAGPGSEADLDRAFADEIARAARAAVRRTERRRGRR